MKLLAIDTSTASLSLAASRVVDGQNCVWSHTAPGGAQASSDLLPALLTLLRQAGMTLQTLDAIAFGAGPGSFTGLRTACAVAQGLGFGANVPLLPVDSLLAVAEDARHTLAVAGPLQVLALLDARMDEVYSARYVWDGFMWSRAQTWAVSKPETLHLPEPGEFGDPSPSGPDSAPWLLAGNAFAEYGSRLLPGQPELRRVSALPTAEALLRLTPALLAAGEAVAAEHALPRYIRDKVAQTTAERAALKAGPP